MEQCIYHSRDLDGLTSGAIIYGHQITYGDDCFLTPYDYGEKLDTRKFKGKPTIMLDVSMEMDRMELLGKNTLELIWVDHHISAYNKLHEYCEEKGHSILKTNFNDLIERIEVKGMNLIYFYSSKISACEIAAHLYARNMGDKARELIRVLGQYDTWRNTDDKKFGTDHNWDKIVMPVQYYMRSCHSPVEVFDILKRMDYHHDLVKIEDIVKSGDIVYKYQKSINETLAKKYFEFEFEGLKVIALNTPFFNSNSFSGYYHPDVHDAMMPFQYDGKTNKWKFSLYTTKEEEVDLLSAAQKFGGGGHKKACGFEVPAEWLYIHERELKFVINDLKNEENDIIPKQRAIENIQKKTGPSQKGHVYKKDSFGIEYLIPNLFVKDFDNTFQENHELCKEKFNKYIYNEI